MSTIIGPKVEKPSDRAWWKSASVYQIYPASFADHAANGHGTLQGILSKVPYLHKLGVDIVWLSPMYESPQADMGYDISDYQKVDPQYGTLEDWEQVKDACHERGMKLVMDLVVNHSSDQHAWFKESRKSKDSPKRDWYIWHDGKTNDQGERVPPNNWRSIFGTGPAWTFDDESQQWYCHTFLKEQPDLNWKNPELRKAVYDMMHWWLAKGADGFRMDVINFIAKAEGFPDAPIVQPGHETQPFGGLSINRPEVHGHLKEMYEEVISKYDMFCVGECPGDAPVSEYAPYSVPANKELQMIFHFHHQGFDRGDSGFERSYDPKWKLSRTKTLFNGFNVEMEKEGGWNSNYVENHDQPRIVSRMGSDHPAERAKSAKMTAMFHTSLTGTIFIYQGQEIGLCNVPRDWAEEEYKDIETIQALDGERDFRWKQNGKKGKPEDIDVSDVMRDMRWTARDNGRTPMQWDSSEHAGFSKATPWMRVHDDYKEGWNVAAQVDDPNSVFSFWQKLLKLRKEYEALVYGTFIPLDEKNEKTYSYIRHDKTIDQKLLVILNFSRSEPDSEGYYHGEKASFEIPSDIDISKAKLIITNGEEKEGSGLEGNKIELSEWEGRVYVL